MGPKQIDSSLREFLSGRHIGTVATENADGSIHMTAVWYVFEDDYFYIATSSKTRKARNLTARPKASLMVDSRKPGKERGVTAIGRSQLVSGKESQEINRRIHSRYLSSAALADAKVGPVFAGFDDVTIRIVPDSWISWDMAALDAQVFAGSLGNTPGYMLPLD
jgi:PPOX class probable F420-dependent enzyme